MTTPTTFARLPGLASLCVTALLAIGLAACGGNGKVAKPDQAPAAKKEKREPKAPVPENLGETPCGNPDWGQLPDQHQIDGDPPADASSDSSSSSDDDQTSDN